MKINISTYNTFKFVFYQTLKEQETIDYDDIWFILECMERYKPAILNIDTPKQLFIKKFGSFEKFVSNYTERCY